MSTIEQYAVEKLNAGADLDALRKSLLSVGWKEDTVDEAIAKALVAQGVPSPVGSGEGNVHRTATVEVVINFFSFVLLGISSTALGILYFGIIDRFFPDPLAYAYGSNSASVHYAIAALIVAFPLYVAAVHLWFRRFREDKEKEESKLSKWLTYIVLLITAVTIVGDLIMVIFNFLQGELSPRFFLKALAVLVVAGSIFGFYFFERKKIQYKSDISRKTFLNFGYGIGALVAIGIILGFIAAGTPATERMRQLDSQRANDLRSIAGCVTQFASDRGILPGSLAELEESGMYSYCASTRFDPESGVEYAYRVVTPLASDPVQAGIKKGAIELCADFSLEQEMGGTDATFPIGYIGQNDKWNMHGVGRSCDVETVVAKDVLVISPAVAPEKIR